MSARPADGRLGAWPFSRSRYAWARRICPARARAGHTCQYKAGVQDCFEQECKTASSRSASLRRRPRRSFDFTRLLHSLVRQGLQERHQRVDIRIAEPRPLAWLAIVGNLFRVRVVLVCAGKIVEFVGLAGL